MAPAYIPDNFTHSVDIHDHNTRHASAGNLLLPKPRTEYLRKSFNFNGPKLWNVLPDDIKCMNNIASFRARLKMFLKNE